MANKQWISLLPEPLGCISSLDSMLDFLSLEVISITFIYLCSWWSSGSLYLMVFVLLQSSFRTVLKNSCPKRHVGFPQGVRAKPWTGVSYTCSESFSWLCQFLSTKLLMPLVPSNLSYQTSLWGCMWNGSRNWVNNYGWGALLDSGVVITLHLSTCLLHHTADADLK